MSKQFVPREYQLIIDQFIHRHKRCAIWADMGMGKTTATLTSLVGLNILGEMDWPVLVIAPLRVANTTWPDEVEKWAHLNDLRVSKIIGSPGKRRKALLADAELYTVNYDNIEWLVDECFKTLGYWPFRTIVADEATKLKGFRTKQGTKRAKALARVAHEHCDRFIELTGTPSPNGLKDLWGQLWFLDGGKRLKRTWTAFTESWFRKSYDGFGLEPLPFAQEQIQNLVSDICLRVDAKDFFDLREPIVNIIPVDLPEAARAQYDEMEEEMWTELEDDFENIHKIEAMNAAARTMKCLQLASGAAYLPRPIDEDGKPYGPIEWGTVHDEKIEALRSIIEESSGKPILVSYYFKSDLERLLKAFPQARQLDKNPQTQKDWNAGKIPVLLAHPASAGHGLNLQDGGHILVYFSHTWNLEEHDQIKERIGPVRQMQAGHERPVFIHYIVGRNTVDEMVLSRLDSKRSVQEILMEAVKRRKEGPEPDPFVGEEWENLL